MDEIKQPPTQNSVASTASGTPSSVWDIYFPRQGRHGAVYLASFPPIIYFWPVILACFLSSILQGVGASPSFVGWMFVIITVFNFMVLVDDFDQKRFIILILSIVVFTLAVWIINLYGFTFLKSLASWFLSFAPTLSTDAYLLVGFFLVLQLAWALVRARFDYWCLEPNEFVHYTQPAGRDISIARANCTVTKEIPDIFECLLSGGGGTLVIRRNEQILATIPNIPFLGLRMPAIEHLLSETRVFVQP